MKAIILYLYPDRKSTLIVKENGEMSGSEDFVNNESCREYILKRYRSLGKSFEEVWEKVEKHNNDEKLRKDPFFWDDPYVKLEVRELED